MLSFEKLQSKLIGMMVPRSALRMDFSLKGYKQQLYCERLKTFYEKIVFHKRMYRIAKMEMSEKFMDLAIQYKDICRTTEKDGNLERIRPER